MKVVLIRPPKILGAIEKSMVQHPINLLYLSAVLREYGEGFEPEVWDFEVERFSEKEVRQRLRKAQPGVVGITSMTCNIKTSHQIVSWVKDEDSEILTVLGGAHGSAIPERTLKEFENFDVVVLGEGERTFLEICERKKQGKSLEGVAGIVWRKREELVKEPARALIEDLDWLPNPARDLIDHSLYKGASTPGLDATLHRGTELFTSRGCPERCIFCASHLIFGRKVRFRSPEHIFREVDECIEKWGYRHFTIDDDTFTFNSSRLEKICQGFKERGITWDCDTRVDTVNREMIKMMAEAGCQKIAFGVESGSQRILDLNKKGITIEQVKNAFRWAHEFGIITTAFFMIGSHPSETRQELEQSFKLMCELDTELMAVAIAVPYPGTELYQIMKEQGLIIEERWEKFTHLHSFPGWRTEHFTPKQLAGLQIYLFRRFFLRPRFILKTLKKAMSWRGIKYYTRSLWQILCYLLWERRN